MSMQGSNKQITFTTFKIVTLNYGTFISVSITLCVNITCTFILVSGDKTYIFYLQSLVFSSEQKVLSSIITINLN